VAGAQPGAKDSSGVKPAAGEDTVHISSAHSDVQTLKANFAHVPEVRAAKVKRFAAAGAQRELQAG